MGYQPRERTISLIRGSDLLIQPSIVEGISSTLLEAMACGLGIIVTDVPAIREWISSRNGIMIEKENGAAIADALEQYYNRRTLIQEHGQKNINIASERANWDKNYLMLKEIYDILTEPQSPP